MNATPKYEVAHIPRSLLLATALPQVACLCGPVASQAGVRDLSILNSCDPHPTPAGPPKLLTLSDARIIWRNA